jgi:hypothetical protein
MTSAVREKCRLVTVPALGVAPIRPRYVLLLLLRRPLTTCLILRGSIRPHRSVGEQRAAQR